MTKPKAPIGRTTPRTRYICESCRIRKQVGTPKAASVWTQLRLTQEQWRLLVLAAAEFRDLSAELGEAEHAVDFVDWIEAEVVEVRDGMTSSVIERLSRATDSRAKAAA